jgi:hypothetical protein
MLRPAGVRSRWAYTMDWLSVAVLGIIWAAFLVPWPRRGVASPKRFPDLRMNVELQKDATQKPGRWVLAPKKGTRFVGPRERSRLRARERRRRIVVVLLEAAGLTALIGIFPPLRSMLFVTGLLGLLLLSYLGLVAWLVAKGQLDSDGPHDSALAPSTVVVLPEVERHAVLEAEQERLARVVNR